MSPNIVTKPKQESHVVLLIFQPYLYVRIFTRMVLAQVNKRDGWKLENENEQAAALTHITKYVCLYCSLLFSTNKWSNTCPSTNFPLISDRRSTITMNTDTKARCLTRRVF